MPVRSMAGRDPLEVDVGSSNLSRAAICYRPVPIGKESEQLHVNITEQ